MLVLLLAGWTAARAVWWDDPFAPRAGAQGAARIAAAAPTGRPARLSPVSAPVAATSLALPLAALGWLPERRRTLPRGVRLAAAGDRPGSPFTGREARDVMSLAPFARPTDPAPRPAEPPLPPAPFLPASARGPARAPDQRWSVDGWAFWRQGSDSAPVSQGRVPVYGASQAGAVLQYRLAPGAPRDPRLYARAYRALVRQGENELALGASARPLARVPLRLAGEVRYTDAAFSNSWRPAAYAVTEIPPLRLPLGAALEAYGQAGWVGGPQPTPFADGQASITRELPQLARLSGDRLRLSLGAAAWGGAQEDAQRVDVGPTLRLDLRIGEVPARLSVDWRQQVAGDASPRSGVAVTLATGF